MGTPLGTQGDTPRDPKGTCTPPRGPAPPGSQGDMPRDSQGDLTPPGTCPPGSMGTPLGTQGNLPPPGPKGTPSGTPREPAPPGTCPPGPTGTHPETRGDTPKDPDGTCPPGDVPPRTHGDTLRDLRGPAPPKDQLSGTPQSPPRTSSPGCTGPGWGGTAGQGRCPFPRGTPRGAEMLPGVGAGTPLLRSLRGGPGAAPAQVDGDWWHVPTAGLRKATPAQLPPESPKTPPRPQTGMGRGQGGGQERLGDPVLLQPGRGSAPAPNPFQTPPMTPPRAAQRPPVASHSCHELMGLSPGRGRGCGGMCWGWGGGVSPLCRFLWHGEGWTRGSATPGLPTVLSHP